MMTDFRRIPRRSKFYDIVKRQIIRTFASEAIRRANAVFRSLARERESTIDTHILRVICEASWSFL
jgi:hypothetical protein